MHIETIGIRDLAVYFSFGGIVVVEVVTGFRFNQFTIYIVQYFLHDGPKRFFVPFAYPSCSLWSCIYKLPVLPPSTGRLTPLIYPAAGEARKATTAPTSLASAIRPAGISA